LPPCRNQNRHIINEPRKCEQEKDVLLSPVYCPAHLPSGSLLFLEQSQLKHLLSRERHRIVALKHATQ